MPTKIAAIPTHCAGDTRSRKNIAANPTVTAPYSEASTLTTEVCSRIIPKLLKTYALVSSKPTPKIKGASRPSGAAIDCRNITIAAAVASTLVSRINHTDDALPSIGTTRNPSSQNITPNPTADSKAHSAPTRLFADDVVSSGGFTSRATCSPRATRTTPEIVSSNPASRIAVSRSPVDTASTIVSTG